MLRLIFQNSGILGKFGYYISLLFRDWVGMYAHSALSILFNFTEIGFAHKLNIKVIFGI